MEYNINTKTIIKIKLLNDIDVFEFKYINNNNNKEVILLSNKATYYIPVLKPTIIKLPSYSFIKYELSEFDKDFEMFLSNYSISTLGISHHYSIDRNSSVLFNDIKDTPDKVLYETLKRVLSMTLYYKENSSKELLDDIIYCLDFITKNYYHSKENYIGNWWSYEIGASRVINEILFLLYEDIDYEKIISILNIENFYLPDCKYLFYRRNYPNIKRELATYANLADNIHIVALKAILCNDKELLISLFEEIDTCLQFVTEDDGFYDDGGFIQHNNVPYNASYGEVLITSISKLLEIFSHFMNCEKYIEKIINIFKKCFEPFLFNGLAIECVRGRSTSRERRNLYYSYDVIMASVKRLFDVSKNKYLGNIIENGFTDNKIYIFDSINRYVKKTSEYILSISSNSSKIATYESILEENLLGYYSSNNVIDIYYKNKTYDNHILTVNPFYRMGSTNTFNIEAPNIPTSNESLALTHENILCTYFKQKNDVSGNFTKCIIDDTIICIGSNIKSNYDYITNIYTSNGESVSINTDNKLIVETVNEKRSYRDININGSELKHNIEQTRYYLNNSKNYIYDINKKINYKCEYYDNYHIIYYDNYLIINVFEEIEVNLNDICILGPTCSIIDIKNKRVLQNKK